MSARIERSLLCIRRQVPDQHEEAYRELWGELARRVGQSGSHAWRFRAPADGTERLEFLEFEAAQDPREDELARGLMERLDREIGVARVEQWLEDR